MTTFKIVNTVSGIDLGSYVAADEQGAILAMHRDAGYPTREAGAEAMGVSVQDLDDDLHVTAVG